MVKLSIITVCYNAAQQLQKTINSILQLRLDSNIAIEHLLIDNQSKDNTSEVVSAYLLKGNKKSINVKFISDSDKGIYDAMNKGITLASGDWLILLNAGDTFYDKNTILDLYPYLESDGDILVGSYNRLDLSGAHIVSPPALIKLKERMIFCHQALVFRTEVHRRYKYDLNYSIVADYDTILRMYLDKLKFQYINVCLVNYDVTGVSANRMIDTHKEIYFVRKNNSVINNSVKASVIYYYGLIKRLALKRMPQSIRWKIVGFRNKHFGKKYL